MTEIFEQLEINNTFFIEFLLFGVFFILLSGVYLKPFQKLIERRAHKLKDEVQGSADLLKEVESKLTEYEKELSKVRQESLKNYEKALSEVKAKEDAAINSFKDELKRDYTKAAEQLQAERQKVETELKVQVTQFADALAERAMSGK